MYEIANNTPARPAIFSSSSPPLPTSSLFHERFFNTMGKGTGMAVLMSSAPTAQRRLVNANSARRRRRVVVRAEEVKDGVEPEVMTGVRWDPAQLRWVRDERPGRVMEKTNKPISGIAYTVRAKWSHPYFD